MDNQIKAVVFDMDGVLFDTERICTIAWREEAKAENLGDIEKAIVGCVGLNLNDTKAFFQREYGEDFPFDTFHGKSGQRFKDIIERDGLPVMKGVNEILSYLKEQKYPVAIASSTRREGVLKHLERSGLRDYFDKIIGGDMVEHSKPQPDIYLIACRELGVKPENAIAIEDSPNGILSAYAANMKPIMVPDMIQPTKELEAKLYARCDSLLDVLALLQSKERD